MIKTFFASLAATAAMAGMAVAQDIIIPPTPKDEPEISALEGTAALAVVAALVLLAWERRRRAS